MIIKCEICSRPHIRMCVCIYGCMYVLQSHLVVLAKQVNSEQIITVYFSCLTVRVNHTGCYTLGILPITFYSDIGNGLN